MADIDTTDENENIELEEITQIEEDEAGEEETNLDEDEQLERLQRLRDPNASIAVPQGFNPDLEGAPEPPRGLKRVFTLDRKIFLKNALNVSLNKGDGPNSTTLFDNLQLTNDERTGKNNGAKYKGAKIIVVKDGKYVMSASSDKKIVSAIKEFNETLEKAKAEHEKTLVGTIEKSIYEDVDLSHDEATSIISSIEEETRDRIEDLITEVRRGGLTTTEVDELIGVLSFERTQNMTSEEQIKFLTETELPHWEKKLEETEDKDSVRAKQLESVVEVLQLKADLARMKINEPPQSEFAKSVLKNETEDGDISRFKRFQKWAKENLTSLSAITISAAGIVTTVVIAGRKTLKAGSNAVKKVAKALYEVAKKVAPVFGAVLNLLGSILTSTAKGLNWVSKNLWSLALLIVYVLINGLRKRRVNKTH